MPFLFISFFFSGLLENLSPVVLKGDFFFFLRCGVAALASAVERSERAKARAWARGGVKRSEVTEESLTVGGHRSLQEVKVKEGQHSVEELDGQFSRAI